MLIAARGSLAGAIECANAAGRDVDELERMRARVDELAEALDVELEAVPPTGTGITAT